MARVIGATSYVEVGVFTGYSSLAMALALEEMHGSNARVIACDVSAEYLAIAEKYWRDAGVGHIVDARAGPALDTLAVLEDDSVDMIFVDADKTGYPGYFTTGTRLLRPGGLFLFDNVLWNGSVADPDRDDDEVAALRRTAELAKSSTQFDIAFTAIGDGLLICRKRG